MATQAFFVSMPKKVLTYLQKICYNITIEFERTTASQIGNNLSAVILIKIGVFVMSKSVKAKVLAYLSKDSEFNTLTAQKMQSTWGIANPSAVINDLRNEGHAIYLNTRINANGDKVAFYRLGTPTKRMVAEGIAAIRSQGERAFA